MCSKKDAEKTINECLNKERLKSIILKTSIVAWKNVISETQIDRWLTNFTGKYFSSPETEHKLALWMLAHFTYYSVDDVRVLCRNLFNLLIHQKFMEYENTKSCEDVLNELVNDSLFVGLGNESESGNSILYYFRQENRLPKNCFASKNIRYKNIIFIDDVTMSGIQASNYISKYTSNAENKYAGFLIATDVAKKLIKDDKGITPISTMELDKRDQAFSEDSFVFTDPKVKGIVDFAKGFCYEYGKLAIEDDPGMREYPLGYEDGAYLIGFEYNTPDNTLPIFWGTSGGWKPIFKRYEKIYSNGKENAIDGRKYY